MNAASLRLRLVSALVAVGGGLLAAVGILWLTGYDAGAGVSALVRGAMGSPVAFRETLRQSVPLLIAGLGVAIGLRTGLFNIGGEGQVYLGALAGSVVGTRVPELPSPLAIVLVLAAGSAAGGILGGVAGVLRAWFSMNEVITTILLNLLAFLLVSWAVHGPLRDRTGGGYPWSAPLPTNAQLPVVPLGQLGFPIGFAIGLVLVALVAFFLARTGLGLEFRTVGEAPDAARFAGIPVQRRIVQSFVFSGALCGLAGAVELAGSQPRLSDFFSPGYGFTAVAVALVAAGGAPGVAAAAVLFGALRAGSASMERVAGVPSAIVLVVQGLIIVLLVVARSGRVLRRLEPRAPVTEEPA
jgi:simple sugar transport system permease protein